MALPNNSNALQKKLIYDLSRKFGDSVVIYKLDGNGYNFITGASSITYNITKIRRAIVLQSKQVRLFSNNFDFGDAYDSKTRFFILERRYLNGYEPDLNDYIFYNNTRYKMKEIQEPENAVILAIKAEAVEGQMPQEIHQAILDSNVILSEGGES